MAQKRCFKKGTTSSLSAVMAEVEDQVQVC